MKIPISGLVLLVAVVLCLGALCAEKEKKEKKAKNKRLQDEPIAQIDGESLKELSGMARAARSGEYWGVNDRGNTPDLFRFNAQGILLQKVALPGAVNTDWEAVKRENGFLYIGDFGDNDRKRNDYALYKLPEPDPQATRAANVQKFPFHYSDGASHNCEALFILNDTFYLITKVDTEKERPRLFRLNYLREGVELVAEDLGELQMEGVVTDAVYSPALELLAVLTYKKLALFSVRQEKDLAAPPIRERKLDFGQCEGVCFDGQSILITNEEGEIWRYPAAELTK